MEKRCANYVLRAPYPPLPEVRPDARAVRRLLSDYAGGSGALTAAAQYFYSSLLAPRAGESALGDLFACLARVALLHVELLGKLILAYGGDPRLLAYGRNGRPAWWTGANAVYEAAPQRMVEAALRTAHGAAQQYRRTLSYLPDAAARDYLARLLADAEHHAALLTGAKHDLTQR